MDAPLPENVSQTKLYLGEDNLGGGIFITAAEK